MKLVISKIKTKVVLLLTP